MKSLFPSHARTTAQAALLLCLGLAGCAAPPAPKPPPEPAAVAPAPAPAPEPAPAPAEPPAPQPLPANEVQPALRTVANQLQEGDTESAGALLRRVLATDPAQPLALSYLRQIENDPQSLYPRESYAYTVRAGESLSTIARDRMKDTNQFYGLARYNGIKVPKQLSAGQVIRIPGRAPAASATAPAPAPVAAPAPAPAAAPTPAAPASAAVSPERQTANRIAALTKQARTAFARQDLCNAMRRWDEVLALDPNHAVAKAERQKCLELMDRLRQQGGQLAC
ncbi:LysM peptidoglycan-binding domain-containing protein [Roseateles sp. NT4]|uniref:LysM peptidoglycan-binding domain-containing protein n=1 Tax=Roseateles sp. NT4 TaxID=3453715 RepID=UPI003EEE5D7F